jgi:hypothetical protein
MKHLTLITIVIHVYTSIAFGVLHFIGYSFLLAIRNGLFIYGFWLLILFKNLYSLKTTTKKSYYSK